MIRERSAKTAARALFHFIYEHFSRDINADFSVCADFSVSQDRLLLGERSAKTAARALFHFIYEHFLRKINADFLVCAYFFRFAG